MKTTLSGRIVLFVLITLAGIPIARASFPFSSCPADKPQDCNNGHCCPATSPFYCTNWSTIPKHYGIFDRDLSGPCIDSDDFTSTEWNWLKYYCDPLKTCSI